MSLQVNQQQRHSGGCHAWNARSLAQRDGSMFDELLPRFIGEPAHLRVIDR